MIKLLISGLKVEPKQPSSHGNAKAECGNYFIIDWIKFSPADEGQLILDKGKYCCSLCIVISSALCLMLNFALFLVRELLIVASAVAARGFLPPGANVCVAAPSSQIGNWYSYGYNDGIGVDCEQYANLGV